MKWDSEAEIYESIGRFCVSFEQVCRSLEACIRTILHDQGLTNERLHEILLADFTAEPLRRLLQNMVGETLVTNQQEAKVCSKLSAQSRN